MIDFLCQIETLLLKMFILLKILNMISAHMFSNSNLSCGQHFLVDHLSLLAQTTLWRFKNSKHF